MWHNTDFKGYLTCPPSLSEFCLSANYTENYCYQHGYSISGQCVCAEGYFGAHCNSTCQQGFYANNVSCVKECPASTFLHESQNSCVDVCPSSTY